MIYLFYTNAFLLLYSKGFWSQHIDSTPEVVINNTCVVLYCGVYYTDPSVLVLVYSQSHTLKLYLYYLLFYTVLSNRYCTKLHTPEVTSRLNCYIIVHKVLLL